MSKREALTSTRCPYCGSKDLDEFEDETGSYCFGCSSNVFKPRYSKQVRDEIENAVDEGREDEDARPLRRHTLVDEWFRQAGGHHADCDGYRLEHRTAIARESTGCQATPFLYRGVCEECGPLHVGSYGSSASAESHARGHGQEVRCDGRCKDWA